MTNLKTRKEIRMNKIIKYVGSLILATALISTNCFAATAQDGNQYSGIDVAHYDGNVNMNLLKTEVNFVQIKATEGEHTTDSKFLVNANNAQASGIHFGFYHFLRMYGVDSAKVQADRFYNAIKEYKFDVIPTVDVEVTDSQDAPKIQADVRAFVNEFQSLAGYKPILYTYTSFANEFLGGQFSDCKLWIARYNSHVGSVIGWDKYDEWQYSDSGHLISVDNGGTAIDLDTAYGEGIFMNNVNIPSNNDIATSTQISTTWTKDVYIAPSIPQLPYPYCDAYAKVDFDVKNSDGSVVTGHQIDKGDRMIIVGSIPEKGLLEVYYPTSTCWIHCYVTADSVYFKSVNYMKWKNGSTSETVFDKDGHAIGYLNAYESATFLYKENGRYKVLYNTKYGIETKVGYVKYNGGLNY